MENYTVSIKVTMTINNFGIAVLMKQIGFDHFALIGIQKREILYPEIISQTQNYLEVQNASAIILG